jgi:hypothetical protein
MQVCGRPLTETEAKEGLCFACQDPDPMLNDVEIDEDDIEDYENW